MSTFFWTSLQAHSNRKLDTTPNVKVSCFHLLCSNITTFRNWVASQSAQRKIVMTLGFSQGAVEAKEQTWLGGNLQGLLEEGRDSGTECHPYILERLGVPTDHF